MGCGSGFGGLLPCAWCALLFPLRGLSARGRPRRGRPAGAAARPGLRPVLDPAARSHEMAAAREREQRWRLVLRTFAARSTNSVTVRGHEKVPVYGQVEVLAGGQLKVPIPRSSCRPGL
jgi:hypothetical protein